MEAKSHGVHFLGSVLVLSIISSAIMRWYQSTVVSATTTGHGMM
jgi:hypothetical protein